MSISAAKQILPALRMPNFLKVTILPMSAPFDAPQFYESMRDVQQFVVGELARMELSRDAAKSGAEAQIQEVQHAFSKFKQFYLAQLVLTRMMDGKKLITPEKARELLPHMAPDAALPLKEAKDPLDASFDHKDFAHYCAETKDEIQIDWLTFSAIPSLFKFFVLESMHPLLKDFLGELRSSLRNDMKKYGLYCRALFLSPAFVKFVNDTVHPLLQPLLNEKQSFNMASLLTQILEQWQKDAGSIPRYVKLAFDGLSEEDGKVVLSDCLWKPLVTCPQRFLACNVYDPATTSIFVKDTAGADLLDHANTLSGLFLELFKGEGISRYEISRDQEAVNGIAFYRRIFSPLDIDAINKDKKTLSSWNPNTKQWQLTLYSFKDECKPEEAPDFGNQTMNSGMDSYYLRQLLKAAPLLRENVTFADDVTARDIVEVALVSQADLKNQLKQRYLFRRIRNQNNIAHDVFGKDMKRAHDEQYTALVRNEDLNKVIESSLKSVSDAIHNVLCYLPIRVADNGGVTAPPFGELLQTSVAQKLQEMQKTSRNEPWFVLYAILSRSITYRQFRVANVHLTTYDTFARQYLDARKKKDLLGIIQDIHHGATELQVMSNFNGSAEKLRKIFSDEGTPFEKLAKLEAVFTEIRHTWEATFVGSQVFDAQVNSTALMVVLTYASPAWIVTMFHYMDKMCPPCDMNCLSASNSRTLFAFKDAIKTALRGMPRPDGIEALAFLQG